MVYLIIVSAIAVGLSIVALANAIKAFNNSTHALKNSNTCENFECTLCRSRISALMKCHKWSGHPIASTNEVAFTHYPESANTASVPNVTLQELSSLVLDGIPIKRNVAEPKEYLMHIEQAKSATKNCSISVCATNITSGKAGD